MSALGTSLSDRVVVVPAAILGVLLVAVALRWIVRRTVDRAVRSLSDNAFARRLARARSARDGDEAARIAAERSAARSRTVGSLLKSGTTFVLAAAAAIIVLALVGLDVAPLLASAGIVGIAVGFGAQSLIRDFLTG